MPEPDWDVRALRFTDHKPLAAFQCANPGEPWTQVVEDRIRSDLYKAWVQRGENGPDLSVYIVEGQTGSLLGVVACIAEWNGTNFGQIPLLGVDPDHRRQGIATVLKQAAMDSLARSGCPESNLPMQGVNRLFEAQTEQDPQAKDYLLTVVRFE